MENPVAQEAGAHGCCRAIECAEKCHPSPGAGLHQLEVALRGGVENEKLAAAVGLELLQVAGRPAHLARDVVQQRSGGTRSRRKVAAPKSVEGVDFKMGAQKFAGGLEFENIAVERSLWSHILETLCLMVRYQDFHR